MHPLLTPRQAAEHLKLGVSTLAKLRATGEGPRPIRVGKSVRYSIEELDRWTAGLLATSIRPGAGQ